MTYAFVDASNLTFQSFDQRGWKLDLKALLKYLKERFGASKLFYYAGSDPKNTVQLQLHEKMREWGYEMQLNTVKRFKNQQGELYLKADVDSRMTFEIMLHFPHYDRAVVLTGDGDFFWVLQYLLREKSHIWLVANSRKTAKELKMLFGYLFCNLDDYRHLLEFKQNTKK